jgi:PAS domain S-box-containing protein
VEYADDFVTRVLDGVPQPVWVIDEAGLIVFANPAAVGALGYDDVAELQGKPSHETVHYQHVDGSPFPAADCQMLVPRTTGEPVQSDDDWFVRKDGTMLPIAWWSAPIDMPTGRGVVLSFIDTTQRRAAEQAVRDRDAAEIRATESRAAQRRILESATNARRQLARDLHDGAQQHFVNLMVALRMAREELADDPAAATSLLDEAVERAKVAVSELRELAAGLHPSILTNRGLVDAVESLATRAALPVRVVGTVDGELPEALEVSAYFVVAEAVTNAVKHSQATEITVTLHTDDHTLTVEITDDGKGGATQTSGTGLAGIADRVDTLGGTFELNSPKGKGTSISIELPR